MTRRELTDRELLEKIATKLESLSEFVIRFDRNVDQRLSILEQSCKEINSSILATQRTPQRQVPSLPKLFLDHVLTDAEKKDRRFQLRGKFALKRWMTLSDQASGIGKLIQNIYDRVKKLLDTHGPKDDSKRVLSWTRWTGEQKQLLVSQLKSLLTPEDKSVLTRHPLAEGVWKDLAHLAVHSKHSYPGQVWDEMQEQQEEERDAGEPMRDDIEERPQVVATSSEENAAPEPAVAAPAPTVPQSKRRRVSSHK